MIMRILLTSVILIQNVHSGEKELVTNSKKQFVFTETAKNQRLVALKKDDVKLFETAWPDDVDSWTRGSKENSSALALDIQNNARDHFPEIMINDWVNEARSKNANKCILFLGKQLLSDKDSFDGFFIASKESKKAALENYCEIITSSSNLRFLWHSLTLKIPKYASPYVQDSKVLSIIKNRQRKAGEALFFSGMALSITVAAWLLRVHKAK